MAVSSSSASPAASQANQRPLPHLPRPRRRARPDLHRLLRRQHRHHRPPPRVHQAPGHAPAQTPLRARLEITWITRPDTLMLHLSDAPINWPPVHSCTSSKIPTLLRPTLRGPVQAGPRQGPGAAPADGRGGRPFAKGTAAAPTAALTSLAAPRSAAGFDSPCLPPRALRRRG